jgi:hypothetical protein
MELKGGGNNSSGGGSLSGYGGGSSHQSSSGRYGGYGLHIYILFISSSDAKIV